MSIAPEEFERTLDLLKLELQMWVLGNELGFSLGDMCVFNHGSIPLVPHFMF